MADAFKSGKAMPQIIDNDDSSYKMNDALKQLTSQMVSFESPNRPSIEEVRTRLGKLNRTEAYLCKTSLLSCLYVSMPVLEPV